MSKRFLFAALIGALLFSAASQSQSAPKVYAETSLSVPPDRVVNLKFLTEGRILFETCHFREDCDLQILGVTEGKVDRSDARRVPYSEAANLFRELNQVKRFGCSGPADNVADAMIFAMTCEKRTGTQAATQKYGKIRPPNGHLPKSITAGIDDQILLFSAISRKLGFWKRLNEDLGDLASFGMGAAGEWDNHQEIMVADNSTGKVCADWHFESNHVLFAEVDISPAGKFVARFLDGKLSIYPVADCR